MKRIAALATFSLLAVAGCTVPAGSAAADGSVPAAEAPSSEVRNIILLIADGGGVGVWTAAAHATDRLAVQSMPVVGLLDTRSARHRVSDSAAGATAFATGERVMNRTVSVGPAEACPLPLPRDTIAGAWPQGCEPLETWFQLARDRGRATGVVTTAAVVDATPAAFIAQSPSRYWRDAIAEQYAAFGLDVMLGGGRRYFAGATRPDRKDLLGPMCARAHCIASAAELAAYRPDDRPLVGLFAPADLDEAEPRAVGLPQMVAAALARLSRNPHGFVAVFESEAIDNATHDNAPLERVTADMIEFDDAVGVALEFARRTPGTLVIVTSDHETGGVSLVEDRLLYGTTGHTGDLVPIFAEGAGAERFGGWRENAEVGREIMGIVRGWRTD